MIPELHTRYYISLAQSFTKKYLRFFPNKCTMVNELDEVMIYRGKGNKAYYKNNYRQNRPDKLSIFTGLNEAHPFFEDRLF